MNSKHFPWFIAGLYFLGLLLILAASTFFGLRRVPDSAQMQSDKLQPVYNDQPVSQTITPVNNGLNTVVIYLKNARLLNTDPLLFSLSDSGGRILRDIHISGRNIGDGETVRFQFPPLPDSAGRTYTLLLQAPDTAFDEPLIEVGFSSSDVYPGGQSGLPGETGDMSFQLFYRPGNYAALASELTRGLAGRIFRLRFLLLFAGTAAGGYFLMRRIHD